MSTPRLLVVSVLAGLCIAARPADHALGYAITRSRGDGLQVGDLVAFDIAKPQRGWRIGATGLPNVGAVDVMDGILWAASERDEKLRFYTVDVNSAEATHVSTFEHPFLGGVFAGSFDDNGAFWTVDMRRRTLYEIDPMSGKLLSSTHTPVAPNGIEIIDGMIYTVRGGTGDPPQEFGTIDRETGEFHLIGATKVGVEGNGGGNGCGALDFDWSSDTMYLVYRSGIERGQRWSLYTLDLATGLATFVNEIRPRGTYDAFAVSR